MYIAGSKQTIDTGEIYFDEISRQSRSASVVAKVKLERQRIHKLEVADIKPLEARAEHSRWIVDCPNCGNAEFYFEDRLFLCHDCGNSDIDGKARKVRLPKQRQYIEVALLKRQIKNRHWYPGETLDDLKVENFKTLGVI